MSFLWALRVEKVFGAGMAQWLGIDGAWVAPPTPSQEPIALAFATSKVTSRKTGDCDFAGGQRTRWWLLRQSILSDQHPRARVSLRSTPIRTTRLLTASRSSLARDRAAPRFIYDQTEIIVSRAHASTWGLVWHEAGAADDARTLSLLDTTWLSSIYLPTSPMGRRPVRRLVHARSLPNCPQRTALQISLEQPLQAS